MANLRDIYTLNIQGNFAKEMERVQKEIDDTKRDWLELAGAFRDKGASFTKKSLKELQADLTGVGKGAKEAAEKVERLDSAGKSLAKAQRSLTSEQNRLNAERIKELEVLAQLQRKTGPRQAATRAEVGALKRLTSALAESAEQRIFEQKVAEAGLTVTADGKRLFDAEAAAARKAAAAVQKLAVAEALRKQGRDPSGELALFTTDPQGKRALTPAGEEAAKKKAQAALEKKIFDDRVRQEKTLLGLPDPMAGRGKTLEEINTKGKQTESVFNRVSFTFRRLIGIMAVFTVARVVVRGFREMITHAIRFNAAIESNRVGMAGLIAASAEVRGADGERLSLVESLNRAQDIAIDQMAKLRANALTTAASYEELADAFTQAVAPGLTAGLTLDQIRKVTTDISQAATGLGVAQNQLSEEIRSLFQGSITPRNTRIASALGISNEDIRRAKELGILFEFLQGRFASISATGKRLMNTFTGQLSNAADAFSQLLAETSRPLFEQLKGGLKELQEGIFKVVDEQAILKPGALKAFGALFDGLARGVQGIRTAFQNVDVGGFADAFGVIGESLGTAATIIAKVFAVFFDVAAPAATLLKVVFSVLTSIVNAGRVLDKWAGGFLSGMLKVYLKTFLLYFTFLKLAKAAGFIALQWNKIRTAITLSTAAIKLGIKATGTWAVAVNALKTPIRGFLVPLIAISAILITISEFLPKAFKEDLFKKIGSAVDYVLEKMESLFGLLKSAPEEALTKTQENLGVLKDQLADLRTELQEVSKENADTLRQITAKGKASLTLQGLPSNISSQLQEIYDAEQQFQEKLLNLTRKRKETEEEIAGIGKRREGERAELLLREEQISLNLKNIEKNKADLAAVVLQREKETFTARSKGSGLDRFRIFAEEQEKDNVLRKKQLALQQRVNEDAATEQHLLDQKKKTLQEIKDLAANEKVSKEKQKDLNNALLGQEREAASVKNRLLLFSAKREAIEARIASKEKEIDSGQEEGRLKALLSYSDRALAVSEADTVLQKTKLQLKTQQEQKERVLLELRKRQEEAARSGIDGLGTQLAIGEQISEAEKLWGLEKRTLETVEAIHEEEKRRANLRKEGGVGDGISESIKQWAADNQGAFRIGENLATGFAEGLASAVGSSVRAALSSALHPEEIADLAGAIRGIAEALALDLLTGFVTDSAKAALAGLFGGTSKVVEGAAAGTAAGTSMTTAATPGLAAAGTGAGVSMSAIAATNFPGIGTAAGVAMGIAFKATIATQQALAAIGSAGGVPGKAHGGKITGFASGGGVRRRPPRPLGMDTRDTVPAMLRPGEWVIRPEAVRLYGDRFMSLLNRGKVNTAALRGIAGPSGPPPTPKRSFATGGPVVASRPSRDSKSTVNVVNYHDEQTMDRALSAGPESMLRFARKHRGAYRAALGI